MKPNCRIEVHNSDTVRMSLIASHSAPNGFVSRSEVLRDHHQVGSSGALLVPVGRQRRRFTFWTDLTMQMIMRPTAIVSSVRIAGKWQTDAMKR